MDTSFIIQATKHKKKFSKDLRILTHRHPLNNNDQDSTSNNNLRNINTFFQSTDSLQPRLLLRVNISNTVSFYQLFSVIRPTVYIYFFSNVKKECYFIETACQCSQTVQFTYVSVLFYFSGSFLIFYGPPSVCFNRVSLFEK